MTKHLTLLLLVLTVLTGACRSSATPPSAAAQATSILASPTAVDAVQPSSPLATIVPSQPPIVDMPASTATTYPTPVPTATFEPLAFVPLPCHVAPPDAAATIIPHDVLLATQFELLRYHHETGEIETLVDATESGGSSTQLVSLHNGPGPEPATIGHVQLSPDRRWLIFSRYWFEIFDIKGDQLTTLADGDDLLFGNVVFAPDGDHLFYTTVDPLLDVSSTGTFTQTLRTLPTDLLDQPLMETLGQSTVLGSFTVSNNQVDYAKTLVPSPDGQRVAVPTAEGVRVFDLDGSSTLVRKNDMEPPYVSYFAPESWSPSGRYLMLDGRFYEGSGKSVQDLISSRGEPIPNASEYTAPGAIPVWINSDKLFSLSPGSLDAGLQPTATIWSLHADREEMLAAEHQFRLLLSAINLATEPARLANGQLVFALVGKSDERGLYTLDFEKRTVQQRNCLPKLQSGSKFHGSARVQWLPDGRGALYYEANYESDARLASPLFYVPLDGSPLVNFDALLGETPRFAAWILEE